MNRSSVAVMDPGCLGRGSSRSVARDKNLRSGKSAQRNDPVPVVRGLRVLYQDILPDELSTQIAGPEG